MISSHWNEPFADALAKRTNFRDEIIMTEEPRIHETTNEARAGSTPGVARNVLVIGTLLVVILFAVIVFAGKLSL